MKIINLNIKDGDIFVIRGQYDHELLQRLAEQLNRKVTIIALNENQSIQQLNEEQMRKAGWVRNPDN